MATKKKTATFYLTEDHLKKIKEHKVKAGVPHSETVKRALDLYFKLLKRREEKNQEFDLLDEVV